jgi:hypothetical protein
MCHHFFCGYAPATVVGRLRIRYHAILMLTGPR